MKKPNSVIDLIGVICTIVLCFCGMFHWLTGNHMKAVVDAIIAIFCITTVEFS